MKAAPKVRTDGFTDGEIEISQELTHPKTKRITTVIMTVSPAEARQLAADLIRAADELEGPT